MYEALHERSLQKPGPYQAEMAGFPHNEFNVLVTTSSIRSALAPMCWTKKPGRHVAKERNADSRDFYLYNLSAFRSYHLD